MKKYIVVRGNSQAKCQGLEVEACPHIKHQCRGPRMETSGFKASSKEDWEPDHGVYVGVCDHLVFCFPGWELWVGFGLESNMI